MGPAHSTVVNHTKNTICVITFNNSDIIYRNYHNLYLIESGQSLLVEANPDPIGLKLGVLYAINPDKQEFHYHRFLCKNDGTLNITELKDQEISFYASRDDAVLQAKGKLRETETVPYNMACEVIPLLPSQLPPGVSPPVSATTRITNAAKTIATNVTNTINTAQEKIVTLIEKDKQSDNTIDKNTIPKTISSDKIKENSIQTPSVNTTPVKKRAPPDLSQPKAASSSNNNNDPSKNWENELKRIKEEARAAALAEIEAKMAKQRNDLENKSKEPENTITTTPIVEKKNTINSSTASNEKFNPNSVKFAVPPVVTVETASVTSVTSSINSEPNNVNTNNNNAYNNSNNLYSNTITTGALIPEPRIKKKSTSADVISSTNSSNGHSTNGNTNNSNNLTNNNSNGTLNNSNSNTKESVAEKIKEEESLEVPQ
eukprot:gene20722-26866_t